MAHAWTGEGPAAHGVVIDVDSGIIRSVVRDVPTPPPGVPALRGLVLPGFANAHSHAFHRALRGHVQKGPGDFWTWRDDAYRIASALDPDSYRDLARATFAEMALSGITAVGEFHYLHHGPGGAAYADPNEMTHALVAAAEDVGIRITVLDTLYLAGGFDRSLEGAQLRFSDGSVDAWESRTSRLSDSQMVRHGLAVHSVRAVPAADLSRAGAVGRRRGQQMHAHVSEQPKEVGDCQAAWGVTPVQLLADHGLIDEQFTAVHATHMEGRDIPLLAAGRSGVCLCPTTERDLADGIGPAQAFAQSGIPLSLGSDSHAVIDLLEESRAVELDERLASGRRGNFTAESLLRMATAAGRDALGWSAAGLAPGGPADFVEIALDSVRLAGCDDSSLLESTVFAAGAADVRTVVVAGRVIVDGGQHVSVDVGEALRASISRVRGMSS